MVQLAAAALAFLVLHLGVSGSRLRDLLVARLGEGVYSGLFSLASLGGIVWMAIAYNGAVAENTFIVWDFGPGVQHLGLPVVFLATMLAVPGLLTPNPTAIGGGAVLASADPARGMVRITRHPFLWGVAIWAGFHMLANGDAASIVFFGALLVLSVLGTVSIDAKRRRTYGEAWGRFAAKTSNVPFAAILMGRNGVRLGEIGVFRLAAGLAVFAGLLLAHAQLFRVSPFPGGWVPF